MWSPAAKRGDVRHRGLGSRAREDGQARRLAAGGSTWENTQAVRENSRTFQVERGQRHPLCADGSLPGCCCPPPLQSTLSFRPAPLAASSSSVPTVSSCPEAVGRPRERGAAEGRRSEERVARRRGLCQEETRLAVLHPEPLPVVSNLDLQMPTTETTALGHRAVACTPTSCARPWSSPPSRQAGMRWGGSPHTCGEAGRYLRPEAMARGV